MNAPTKLGAFVAALALVFVATLGIGRAVGPIGDSGGTRHTPIDDTSMDHQEEDDDMTTATIHDTATDDTTTHDTATMDAVAGLEISSGGYTLAPVVAALTPDPAAAFRFRIVDGDDRPLTDYDATHEKDLHFIVVRRDLSGFQHLHPVLDRTGMWTVTADFGVPGTYRVFADFRPEGADDGLTLGADVIVAGDQAPVPLPEPGTTFEVDGYTVTLAGEIAAGQDSELTLSVSRDGRPVDDLQPYLGAYGHLVALRSGDLAYLHVHPDGEPGDGRTEPGPGVVFHTTLPTAGAYRLYLDFRHGDVVRTAEFTVVAPAGEGTVDDHAHGEGS